MDGDGSKMVSICWAVKGVITSVKFSICIAGASLDALAEMKS